MSQNASDIQNLAQWAELWGTHLDERVEIYQDQVTGLSFRARKDIDAETKILQCSYQTTLSYLNAIEATSSFQIRHSEPFPSEFIEALKPEDPNIISHFFLVQQYLMGEKSFWWPYIHLLPQPYKPENMVIPILWPEVDQEFLIGTNAEPPIKKRVELWKEEWERGISLLRDRFENWESYTYELYQWSATIFGSRSFRASLTIPRELLRDFERDGLSLILEHIRKDRFSILLPIMDIGNHNGINQVRWAPDPASGLFNFSNTEMVKEGSQIYNYYGQKSNSELLVAYGFILPNPELDTLNLKLTPSPAALRLRRSQICHVIRDPNPEQEVMFTLKMAPDVQGLFSHGLIDMISSMVVNRRERRFIKRNPGYCLEKNDATKNENPLSRTYIRALYILEKKLEYEIARIQESGENLVYATPSLFKIEQQSLFNKTSNNESSEPQNYNQKLALDYRERQLRVLQTALPQLSTLLQKTLCFNSFCQHDPQPILPNDYFEFLSLECAYSWLNVHYSNIYNEVAQMISEDQDEPLPLNWAVLVGDWDHTYWIVWIYIVWMIWTRDGESFSTSHLNLSTWLVEMNDAYDQELELEDPTGSLHAESSELDTIDLMINGISKLEWNNEREELFSSPESRERLRNFASFVAQEETIIVPYKMQHSPKGTIVEQKLLYVTKWKGTSAKALNEPWTNFLMGSAANGH